MLTTNDMRVLELLASGGRWYGDELRTHLYRAGFGWEPAMRRMPSLLARGYVVLEGERYAITPEGVEAHARALRAAYGRFATLPSPRVAA